MTDNKTIWNQAGNSGLIMGGISIAYLLLSWLLSLISTKIPVLAGLVSVLLWVVKFGGCIYVFKLLLKQFSARNPEADNNSVFKFGMVVALYSAILYSAAYLAYTMFIIPDQFEQMIDTFRDSPLMDSNSLEAMEQMLPKMPTIGFFVNLIYCWLFGTILSAIFSRNIPDSNPFKNNIDEQ